VLAASAQATGARVWSQSNGITAAVVPAASVVGPAQVLAFIAWDEGKKLAVAAE
jgi:hypothetical protein